MNLTSSIYSGDSFDEGILDSVASYLSIRIHAEVQETARAITCLVTCRARLPSIVQKRAIDDIGGEYLLRFGAHG